MISHTALLALDLLSKALGCTYVHLCMCPGYCRTFAMQALRPQEGERNVALKPREERTSLVGGIRSNRAPPTQSQKTGHFGLSSDLQEQI